MTVEMVQLVHHGIFMGCVALVLVLALIYNR